MNLSSALSQLHNRLEQCLTSDKKRFRRRISGLRRRLAGSLPVDRGIEELDREIEQSIEHRTQRESLQINTAVAESLPIFAQSAAILAAIQAHPVVVIAGETGSGKTTQIPKLCLQAGRGRDGMIACTQPRRIAARSVARRLAEEVGSPLGEVVGYQVRFQEQSGPNTLIKFMTDGVLLAQASQDRRLSAYDTIIIDEAHERSLNIDFLMGYVKRLCRQRPDLRVVITSATIDTVKFAQHFDNAPVIEVAGRSFPVEVRYRPLLEEGETAPADLTAGVAAAVEELAAVDPRGDVLVFASGERDIREICDFLSAQQHRHTDILPLYGRLSNSAQDQIFRPSRGPRRIIVATNVAETSLTVPGIRFVVDTGLARISRYSHRSKIQRLPVEPVSQASAQQRAGRCGRLGPGVCIRLYDETDFDARPEFTEPEILRTNLASVVLRLKSLGLGELEHLDFVDRPEPRLIKDGFQLLSELGALDQRERLTRVGRQMADLPVDVRLARMLIESVTLGSHNEILAIVAGLSVRDPRDRPHDRQAAADEAHAAFAHPKSDFLSWVMLWQAWTKQRAELSGSKLRRWCEAHFLSYLRMREWSDIERQLRETLGKQVAVGAAADYEQVHRALLPGLLSQVGMLEEKPHYSGARGRRFMLFPGSVLFGRNPKWVLTALIMETTRVYARTNAAIDVAWIEPAAVHLVRRSYSEPFWSKKAGRVYAFEQVTLFGLPIVQRRRVHYGPEDPETAYRIFILDGLVRDAVTTRGRFAHHNRQLVADVHDLENKRRQRDLLADESEVEQFFAERVPAHINTTKAFERWRIAAEAEHPQLLYLTQDVLLARTDHGISKQDFPDLWQTSNLQCELKYAFTPGEHIDGVTMEMPLHQLSTLSGAQLDWLVPGLLPGKVEAMLRALPKSLRRLLVPIPQTLEKLMERLTDHSRDIRTTLTDTILAVFGHQVPVDAWSMEIPEHFAFNIRVLDKDGSVLEESRDLQVLQQRYARLARERFKEQLNQAFHLDHLIDWSCPELPESVNLAGGGIAFPALVDQESSVGVRLFEQAATAGRYHRYGILRLLMLKLPEKLKYLQRKPPFSDLTCLRYQAVDSCDNLKSDVIFAALNEGLPAELPRNRDQFVSLAQERGQALVPAATRIGKLIEGILETYRETTGALRDLSGRFAAAEEDITQQLGYLIYPGFLTEVGMPQLNNYQRYLAAVRARLARLDLDPRKDELRMQVVRRYWKAYLALCDEDSSNSLEVERLHWQIEEFRVSVFAQHLKTVEKVSERTLNARLKVLGQSLVEQVR